MHIPGLDPLIILFVLFYAGFAMLCFYAGFKRLWEQHKNKKKPNLKLIQGGKKEDNNG